jgi:arylsulfatase A-like enzyme
MRQVHARHWLVVLLGVVLAGVALALSSCGAPEETSPNIVLVILDTVRDDAVGIDVPGHPGEPLTPWFDQVASEGTTFTNAFANAPWTVPSHASLLTGQYPSTHQCTGYNWKFDYEGPTLAERLNEAGYRTMAFFSNPWLTDRLTGIMRGFEEQYVDPRFGTNVLVDPMQGGPETLSYVERWLEGRQSDEPFLMFVNILEAHLPYAPPRSYREAYLPEVGPGEIVSGELADSVNAGVKDWEEVDWQRVRKMYAGDVHAADSLFGSLVRMLREHGLYDDTVVIVTSDHGELIGEYGFFEHQFGVYEELLAVPLAIRAPGHLERGVRTDPVMLSDLYATILELAGLGSEVDPKRSHSLLGEPLPDDRPVIAEYAGPSSPLKMKILEIAPELDEPYLTTAYSTVRVGGLRLTVGSDGSNMLQDLSDAPMPEDELRERGRELAATLKRLLPRAGRPAAAEEMEVDEDLQQRLRSLGYIN